VGPIAQAFAWDADAAKARQFAHEMSESLGIAVDAVSLPDATREAGILVTATSSAKPFLARALVRPGTFIAAVGADNPHKSELDADLFEGTKVVADSLEQAAAMGDLHHAIEAGKATRESIHAELADIVAGRKPGRTNDAEITIFDSTGLAIEDVASAAVAYERARDQGRLRLRQ